MLDLKEIRNERVRARLLETIEEMGQYAAISYAQRVVAQDETGSLTPVQIELIEACNPDNFLRCYANLCGAHRALKGS